MYLLRFYLKGILRGVKMMNIRQVIDLWRSDRVDVLIYFITLQLSVLIW